MTSASIALLLKRSLRPLQLHWQFETGTEKGDVDDAAPAPVVFRPFLENTYPSMQPLLLPGD